MHCVSCEMLLAKQMESVKWVKILDISHKSWKMTLDMKNNKNISKINQIITDCGYTVKLKKSQKSNNKKIESLICNIAGQKKNPWWSILLILVIFVVVFLLMKKMDIYQYLPSTENASIWVALLMWLVASISTCLAVTGWIVLWFGQYIDNTKWWLNHFRVQGWFQLWRIVGFFLLWGLLGLVWQVFKISMSANAILTIVVWVVLFYIGLHMLGIVSSITKFGFHLPKKWTSKILNVKNPVFAPVIWVLTFFLPCWFTQSMQLVAMSSGNFWQWWLVMAMFALGTMPVLLWIGLWSSYIKEHKFNVINKIIWALIIFFGIFSISNGWGLVSNGAPQENIKNIKTISEEQKSTKSYKNITVWHNGWSLEPKSVILKEGTNYELTILPTSNGIWCMSTMIIPKISRDVHRIVKWQAIVYKLDGLKKWKYPVVCASMWMYQWELVVE